MKQGTVRKDARNEADAKKIEERNKEMKERLKQIKERKATTANLLSKAHEGARKGGGIDLKEEVSNDQEPEVLARSCGGGSTVDMENPVTSVIDEAHEGTRKGGGIDLKEEVSNDQEPEVLARSCGVGSTVDVENPVISVNAEIHGGTTTVGDIPLKEVSNHLESEVMAGSCGGGSISSVKFEGRTLLEPSNLQNDDGSSALPNRMKFTEEDLPQVKDRILKNIMRARYFKELMEKARENPLLNTQLKTLLEPSNLQNDDSSSAPPHQMKFSGEELPHIKDHILKNIMRARYFKELLEKTRENNPLLNTKGMTIEQETSVSNGTPTPKGDEPCVTSMEERTSTKDTSDGCTIGGECSKASVKESSSKPRTRLKNIEDGSTSTDSDSMDILLKPKRQSKSRRARKQEMRERYKILKKRCEKFQEQKLTLVDEAHEGARKGGGIDLKEEVSNDQEPEVLARPCGGDWTIDVEYPVIYIDVEGITLELENSLYKRTRTPKGDEPCVTSMEERTSTKDTSDGCTIGGECSKATVKLDILLEPSNLQDDDSSSAPPHQIKFSEEELPQIEGSILKSIIRARYFEELLEKIRENNPYFNIKGLTIEVEASVSNGTPTSKGDEPCVTSMEERTSTKDTSDGCTIGGECSKASVKLNILLEPSNLQNDDSSSAPPYQMKFSEEELPQIKDYILKGIMRTRYFKELLEKTRENNPPLNIKGMTIGLETSVSNGTRTPKGDEPCVTSMEERTSTKDTSDGCTIGGECSKASVKAHKGARKGGGIDLKEEVSNDQEPGVLVRSCGSCSTVDVEKPIKSFSAEEERDKLIEELEAFRKDFYPLYGIKCKDNADDMENSQHIYECTFERERMRDRKEALRQKRDKILRPVVTSRRGIRSRRLRKRLERFEAENPPSEEELNEDFETLRRAYGPKHDTDSEVEDFEIMEYISLCRLKREHMEQRREILIAKHEGMLRREDDLELRQERQQRLKRQLEQILTHSLKNETDSEQGECMEGLEDSMSLNDVEKSIIKKKKKCKKSKRGAVMEGDEGGTKCNPRKVGKMISKSGKRKKGTKHIPTETDNIPQHAARKKRNPKLEAYRLMLEEKQKEAFEKTKERTRPGINPKYHYLNQKKPAQNIIERAIPGPPRPATKSKLIKPVANKRCNLKVEAMRLEEKRRQKEAFEESKLKTRPGINPKYHYLNRKRPSQEDRAETVPACRKPNRLAANQHKMGARQNTNSDHDAVLKNVGLLREGTRAIEAQKVDGMGVPAPFLIQVGEGG
ncbi:hypothetical protein AAG570_001707 [Ranatra chinensis]|uniref:Uncharacterized protein n=1 Tax=Ranatra chinensis TaxID=642074 RepID=A0ABD0YNB8_9HEMI